MSVFDTVQRVVGNRLSLILIGAMLLVLPLLMTSSFQMRLAVVVWVYAMAAIGLNLLMGFAYQVSLGHAGFFGIGAYSVALGPSQLGLSPALSLPAGIAFCGLLALLLGRPILKLKGHYLAVATLGLGMLIFMILSNEVELTGGPDGMRVPRVVIMGWKVKGTETWYWITGIALLISVWLALNLINSPTGLALRAIHDSEVAASVLGVDVARYKLIVFVISACFASAAGASCALQWAHNPRRIGFSGFCATGYHGGSGRYGLGWRITGRCSADYHSAAISDRHARIRTCVSRSHHDPHNGLYALRHCSEHQQSNQEPQA